MTVTKGKQKYVFPSCSSGNGSSVESLTVASDTESLHNDDIANLRAERLVPVHLTSNVEQLLVLKKYSGKRKVRRYQNRCTLQTLAEEDDVSATVIMEPYKSSFAKLLEDPSALEFWEDFVKKSEEDQKIIIDEFSIFNKNKTLPITQIQEKPFSRISPKIRRTIKIKKNLSLEFVRKSENELVNFFIKTPNEVYLQHPSTYFERLLLHAVAQYHNLQSLGVIENGNKKIQVFNTLDNWTPAECFLTDFVSQFKS